MKFTIKLHNLGFYIRYRRGIFYQWGINLFGLVVIKERRNADK